MIYIFGFIVFWLGIYLIANYENYKKFYYKMVGMGAFFSLIIFVTALSIRPGLKEEQSETQYKNTVYLQGMSSLIEYMRVHTEEEYSDVEIPDDEIFYKVDRYEKRYPFWMSYEKEAIFKIEKINITIEE